MYRIIIIASGILLVLAIVACHTSKETANLSEKEEKDYLQKGQTIAQQTFTALSGRLMAALQQGGVPHAVQYCNLAALPLMDSLSTLYQVRIRRTSLKVRNEQDLPKGWETAVLAEYQALVAEGQKPRPVVKKLDHQRIAVATPIFMAQPCLKCHGKLAETLNEQDYASIKKVYPRDQAIGYVEGDWRGMWSIVFHQK